MRTLSALLVTILAACGGAPTAGPAGPAGPAAPTAAPTAAGASTPAGQPSHDHRGGMVHDFHDAAHWATVFDDPTRDAWQRPPEVMRVLDVKPGMTVADLGAGTGYFEPHLAHLVGPTGHVLALDVEPKMVEHLRERAQKGGLANVEPRVVAADDPGLPPGRVDRVLIVDTWHHLPDRAAYARKLAAGLAPGGTVTVVDFTKESQLGPPVAARVPPEQVAAELRAGGLDARVVDEGLPEQYVVVGRRP